MQLTRALMNCDRSGPLPPDTHTSLLPSFSGSFYSPRPLCFFLPHTNCAQSDRFTGPMVFVSAGEHEVSSLAFISLLFVRCCCGMFSDVQDSELGSWSPPPPHSLLSFSNFSHVQRDKLSVNTSGQRHLCL